MSTSTLSLENSAIPSQLPPGNSEGVINSGFEEKEEERADLGENFLEDFQFENLSTEKTHGNQSDDIHNLKTSEDRLQEKDEDRLQEKDEDRLQEKDEDRLQEKDEDRLQEKESEIKPVTPSDEQTPRSKSNIKLDRPQQTNGLRKDEDPTHEDRKKGLIDKNQLVSLPQTAPKLVVQKKQQLTGQVDDLIAGKDYVWGPLFQELPYKTVTFDPRHPSRPDPYVQEFVRQRKPVRQNGQTASPIKEYNSDASEDEEHENKWHHVTRDIIQAIFVRLLLICHSLLCVWRAVDVKKDSIYWCLALTNALLIIETIYTVVKRQGRDPKWICPCFVIYLGGTVPALWFLQIDKLDRYNAALSANVSNLTDTLQEALSSIEGIQIPVYLDPDTWVAILEQILLFVLVVGRMFLPLGSLSREELSQLLFIFIGSGSDVMELFVVFDEPQFRTNSPLKFATLTVWSVSLLQFTFVFTAAKNPKKIRLGTTEDKYHDVKEKRAVFGIEILSLLISFLLMDGPYCALRLYAIIVYKVVSYGIIFFTCKNILMLVLLLYRLFIICIKYRNRGRDKKAALREIAHHKHPHHHKV